MNKESLVLIGFSLALGGLSGCREKVAFGQVVSTTPVREAAEVETEECQDRVVRQRYAVRDPNGYLGAAAGGTLGIALGSHIGTGGARTAAMVGGALAGGYLGRELQRGHQRTSGYNVVRRECKMVKRPSERIVAYDVQYLHDGKLALVRLDHAPGPMLPLLDGKAIPAATAVALAR